MKTFPSPAAVHDGEADILARVIDNLADHDAKLVYADWLEERDDPRGPLLRDFVQAFRGGKKLPDTKGAPEAWYQLVGMKVMELIAEEGLARKADGLLALALPAIEYEKLGSGKVPRGASRIGGLPDLPADAEWPTYEGEPLGFLAQINFAELRASPVARALPAGGVMSVFCLHDEGRPVNHFGPGTYRVLYSPAGTKLTPRDFPNELSEDARLEVDRLRFREVLTLPDFKGSRALKALLKSKRDQQKYENVNFNMLGNDHLLGHLGLLKRSITRVTRHLITLGDLDGWIDDDVMYFLISEADLKRARFDRVKMTLRQF
jgi:uncharacterized protein (TIGR02996 family)